MTNWRTRVRPLALACVAGLALSACGVNGAPDNGTDPQQSEGIDPDESPLSEFLGDGAGFATGGRVVMSMSSADLTDEERQQMRQVEELVAECMQELGFEYIPNDPSAGDERKDPFADAYSLPADEFAREYGYGITTLMPTDRPADEATDPNQEIRDGLSEAALEEYNRALFGAMAEVSEGGGAVAMKPPTPGETVAPEDQGCLTTASDEVYGGSGPMGGPDMSEFDGLFQDLDALRERIDSDPRLVAATEAWAGCMAEAGYSEFETIREPQEDVMTQMNELYGWEPQDDEGGPSVSIGGPGDADVDVDETALAELQAYEIAVATADYDCQQEHYTDVQHDVAWDFEEQFVEDNRTELERFRDSMAEGPAGRFGVGG
jgi:hypothetical protein